jgi:fucose permease
MSGLRWPRAAVTTVFAVHGFLFASWTAHIPQVKAHLGLSNASLGLALLGAPAGSVSAMLVAAYLLPRFGSRRMVRICLVGYCVAGPFVGLAVSLPTLFLALFVWGAFQGTLDVSMNTQAVAVERTQQRRLMPGLHGCWSIGTFAGAGLGALGVGIGLSLSWQLALLGLPAGALAGWLTTYMLPDVASAPPQARTPSWSRWLSPALLVLGVVAFLGMLCEGAAADWSAVYLRGPLHTSAALAGLGFTSFSLAMVVVRLSGNRLLAAMPAHRLLPVLATIATIGLAAGLVLAQPIAALAGFACLGAGVAAVVPCVFTAAGRLPGLNPGTAVAAVSGFGWIGLVCGPPLIGQIATATSLPVALGLLPVLTASLAVVTALTSALRGEL